MKEKTITIKVGKTGQVSFESSDPDIEDDFAIICQGFLMVINIYSNLKFLRPLDVLNEGISSMQKKLKQEESNLKSSNIALRNDGGKDSGISGIVQGGSAPRN